MSKLIEALNIFLKYRDRDYPTHCEHGVLMVVGISREEISKEDKKQLEELGFFWSTDYDCWGSYKYGSA